MRKNYFQAIIALIINLFSLNTSKAQTYHNYILNKKGDTIIGTIKKINVVDNFIRFFDAKKNEKYDYYLDSVASFFYQNSNWSLVKQLGKTDFTQKYTLGLFEKNNNNPTYIFLPNIKSNYTFRLGIWGNIIFSNTESRVKVYSNGKTTLFEYIYYYNSASVTRSNSMLFISNDSLGVSQLFFPEKNSTPQLFSYLNEVMSSYTADKPEFYNQLKYNYSFDYSYDKMKNFFLRYIKM
ncbi:MAG: hypothetical protein DI598_06825 [Pseudopedobacter saltans]|uniref:Uncharacterized protein n=1 Tax=Pseudopedobacter saltans TaxID=151895 RepID=A0A2W5F533_9SPHI|nr:MAG: hypothetical protein DI598_06825 [Pseudopedobacter saltans]